MWCVLRVSSILGRYSNVLGALHWEMMKAIYHKPEGVKSWGDVHDDDVAGFTPYFDATHVRTQAAAAAAACHTQQHVTHDT